MGDLIDFILNELPNKSYFYLYYLAGFTLLSVLLIVYFSLKNKKKTKKLSNKKTKKMTLDDLIQIANNKKSTTKDLLFALAFYLEHFNVKKNKEKSLKFFELVLNHKNRNKSLFDFFHGKILPANLEFKDELDKLERKALNK